MIRQCRVSILVLILVGAMTTLIHSETIPLPEHPRPDFVRSNWQNLNGSWDFRFDKDDRGIQDQWFKNPDFDQQIVVPFPWGSALSGVKDDADIGWYTRTITVPESWKGQRIFFVIGACDWHTTVWLDGQKLGEHQGGYVPFEFELTENIMYGKEHQLVVRADDVRRQFTLYGKQGYGNARGIWQTPYLEARGQSIIQSARFYPDIDKEQAMCTVSLLEPASENVSVKVNIKSGNLQKSIFTETLSKNDEHKSIRIPIPKPHLWSLDDPYLYCAEVSLVKDSETIDTVETYFGMRKISVMDLPGTDIPYVALNNKPIYLQMTLDQAYHPEGYYTFPSDEFTRNEVLRSKQIGLNAMRVHVKIPLPRKLYWADKLGMLIMEDIPNSWGEPDEEMRKEVEFTLPRMIERDFNHPSIFSWVMFNETWGLKTNNKYLPETQKWVVEIVKRAKGFDPTRLVEDNSPCLYDHTWTDINTWHAYRAGYEWKDLLKDFCDQTFPGSTWNYAEGYKQRNEPMFNSECGNVWGYEGSAGDVDWAWDYHMMINQFRKHPKCCGWLYTEHHDVINEWNGYWRYDRSEKYTGLEEIVPGMTLNDFHAPVYLAVGDELCVEFDGNETATVPLFLSIFTDSLGEQDLTVDWELVTTNSIGIERRAGKGQISVPVTSWMNQALEPIQVKMPGYSCLAILRTYVKDKTGTIHHRNFTTFYVNGKTPTLKGTVRVVSVDPADFSKSKWSQKQWNVLDGLKVNGAGHGYFEYSIPVPKKLDADSVETAVLRLEASAKQLFGKDKEGATLPDDNYMTGGGAHDPSLNPNAYPMTDEDKTPSQIRIVINDVSVGSFILPDDPADHRGVLSWFSQKRDKRLREAGSYGYLISASIPKGVVKEAISDGNMKIRIEVDSSLPGGVAIYGKRFGRYPLDPSVIFTLK
jgi:hypothetical protein